MKVLCMKLNGFCLYTMKLNQQKIQAEVCYLLLEKWNRNRKLSKILICQINLITLLFRPEIFLDLNIIKIL